MPESYIPELSREDEIAVCQYFKDMSGIELLAGELFRPLRAADARGAGDQQLALLSRREDVTLLEPHAGSQLLGVTELLEHDAARAPHVSQIGCVDLDQPQRAAAVELLSHEGMPCTLRASAAGA